MFLFDDIKNILLLITGVPEQMFKNIINALLTLAIFSATPFTTS